MANAQTHIVVVGTGFGGIYACKRLDALCRERSDIRVTLIGEHNYFLMTPFLFEAGSGVIEARHAVNPVRKMFSRVEFVQGRVTRVDLAQKCLVIHRRGADAQRFTFDHVVIAVGGITSRDVIPGSEHALAFKSLADAIKLRNHVIELLEQADVEQDHKRKEAMLRFVIVGGGLVGIELQGELTEFLSNAIAVYRNLRPEDVRFDLIEGEKRIVPEMDQHLSAYAQGVLEKRCVHFRLGIHVKQIEPGKVHLPDGTILESDTIILAAGVAANPLVSDFDHEKDKHGRLVVEPTMKSKTIPYLWALGDCASIPGPDGKPYPMLAQHALREGRHIAENLAAVIDRGDPKPFTYKSRGTLASLGRRRGAGSIYKLRIYGFFAWWVWRTYYLIQMPRLERRIRIMMDWTIALFFKSDVVELDVAELVEEKR